MAKLKESLRCNAQHVGDLVTLFVSNAFVLTSEVNFDNKKSEAFFFTRAPYRIAIVCRVRNWCFAHCRYLTQSKECLVFMRLIFFLFVFALYTNVGSDCFVYCCCYCCWNHSMGIWSCWLHESEKHSTFTQMHFVQYAACIPYFYVVHFHSRTLDNNKLICCA